MVSSPKLLFGRTTHAPAQPPDYEPGHDNAVQPPPYSKTAEPVTVPLKVSDQYVAKPATRSSLWNMPSVEITSSNMHFYEPTAIATTILQQLYAQQALYGSKKPVELVLNGGAEPSGFALLGLVDAMSLLPQSPHISVKSTTEKAGLAALLNTQGLTSMWPQAGIFITPSKAYRNRQTNSDVQRERWLNDQIIQLMATSYIRKSGMAESERENIVKLLKAQDGQKKFNAMQALNQGKKGIISYIKLGNDRGVNRADLDGYFKQQGWDPTTNVGKTKIKEFIRDADNVYHIPARPLSELFPEYAPKPVAHSEKGEPPSLSLRLDNKKTHQSKVVKQTIPPQRILIESLVEKAVPQILHFPDKKPDSILSNDSILFSTEVGIGSINNLAKALTSLDQKRVNEKSQHHIPVYVTSPGGEISAGNLFKDIVKQLQTPVDVIIHGYGASAAVMHLLVGATGKRFAMPHTLLMVHESNIAGQDAHVVGEVMKDGLESILRLLSKKTGRPLEEIRRDTRQDYWLNPLEALFYGKKGLLDGIVVDGNGVITRHDVEKYLQEKLGSAEAAEKYIKERLERRRDMNIEMDRKFDVNDPFDNVAGTIEKISMATRHKLGVHPDFLHSGPHPSSDSIEHIQVKERASLVEIMMQNLPVFSKILR